MKSPYLSFLSFYLVATFLKILIPIPTTAIAPMMGRATGITTQIADIASDAIVEMPVVNAVVTASMNSPPFHKIYRKMYQFPYYKGQGRKDNATAESLRIQL
jgi:hypothetical protein